MKLTRGGEYGMLGVLYLAQQQGGTVCMLSAIAKAQNAPPQFLTKVFQSLTKAGVVKSYRGVKGGFSLARQASDVSMKDVIEAIEGPICLNRDKTCPVDVIWEEARAAMTGVLSRVNFADLARAEQRSRMTPTEFPLHIQGEPTGHAPIPPAPVRGALPIPG
jgi:Rrf2 family transcriptional regulator, iron-sulfur cluster assembly transcription factor